MKRNLYLTGFMGCGKTTVGRELAQRLGRRLVDMDQEVTRRLGLAPSDAFAQLGEDAFRRAERAVLERLAKRQCLVVATGGGVPAEEGNRALMHATGQVVHLAAGLETCRARLGRDEVARRPLWRDAAQVARLFHHRQPAYAESDLQVPVGKLSPQEAADIIAAWVVGESGFDLELEGEPCRVSSRWSAPRELAAMVRGRRVVILCDRHIARLHLERYRRVLDDPLVITIAPGERSKSLRGAERVYQAMIAAAVRRGDLLVAIGGGVITDLGAMVAATYMRGMSFLLVATSLLACVDAAIGGKAAVNLGRVKNIVGCFTKPEAVILDLAALGTLQRRHRVEGLVEAYKTGLVASPELHQVVVSQMKPLLAGDVPLLSQVAMSAARAKAGVVAGDFREAGRRKILNLGHTYGHAVEGHNHYRVAHGRAVAAGLMVAAAVSADRGLLPEALASEIVETMGGFAPPPDKWPGATAAWEMMRRDKKNQAQGQAFVLLSGVGEPAWVDDLTMDQLRQALARLGVDDHE